ncbi:Helix-turn-helix domain [Burkholderia pseudomallei]|uniref:helix-turn-helix transcriptional regulator n=1 Tax=Burkholderia pseudomallei TaxID=28450 RepID=UPI000F095C2A|nr:helix-turn-helix domain-containing protein [Burkholderia pseudomallei]MBF4048807.1 helix-turn-helix domain-containing protein [Burkholderia pseudomallei]CAJ4113044.1 Helix-turn-helix domain [Burkholderia pseudomallei]CAJ5047877.1 Helix-turn-helix domain [Burkholderia pseudomallei]CAJ6856257.1 Helix-turn-helix domain [Burkholderia pseudomallei]CAJ7291022.1 Helix-turn-helix domain [Burkholderia pseudomallei]
MSTAAFMPLNKQDVAQILGVSIRTVENFVSRGRMPAPAHIGARVLWHPDVFYTWLDQALRNGGWDDDCDGECREEKRPASYAKGSPTAPRVTKSAQSRPGVAARLQARQARLLSVGAQE